MTYGLDENGIIVGIDVINESNYSKTIETDKPWNGNFVKPKWDGEDFAEGATEEEIKANQIVYTPEPSQEQLMINALGMQVATLQAKLAGGDANV